MNDSLSLDRADDVPENERTILLVAYILYALEPFTLGMTAIVGVVINHLKVNDTASVFLHSHHRWLMRTFWYTLLWSVVLGLLMVTIILIPICWAGFAVLGIWHLYRIVRGGINFFERTPMPL